jgi:L-lactate utilization protein LutB
MNKAVHQFWHLRLRDLKETLKKNQFDVYEASDAKQAHDLVLHSIIPAISPISISWGGSMTFIQSGLYSELKKEERFTIIDTYDKKIPPEQLAERKRQALLVDLFISGCNAVTEAGHLVNLDMIGNRVAALTFGPRNVLLLVGRNKMVPNLKTAMQRIKDYTAPANVLRLGKKTPCLKTAQCGDCSSPDRICNSWTITEKSFPRGRVKVVLINQDLGL